MAYYNVCAKCGCNLDPGEKCDCEEKEERRQDFLGQHMKISPKTGQMTFCWGGKEELYAGKNVG